MNGGAEASVAALVAQLHDVRAAPLPLWPPAPGWWLLALAAALAAAGAWRAWRRRRRRRWWVPLARVEIERVRAEFGAGALPAAAVPGRLSVILRRAALAARPRAEVARLTGTDWLALLAQMAGGVGLPSAQGRDLLEGPYRGTALAPARAEALLRACSVWLRRAERRC